MAGARLPRECPLREDLRTRLGSGLVFQMLPLTDAQKSAALIAQARARGLALTTEMADYLLARMPRDLRALSAAIAGLDRHALASKRALTMPLLREFLRDLPHRPGADAAAGSPSPGQHDDGLER